MKRKLLSLLLIMCCLVSASACNAQDSVSASFTESVKKAGVEKTADDMVAIRVLKVYGEDMATEKMLPVSFVPAESVAEPSGLFANGMDNVNRLRELKALLDEGILTRDEFEAEKKKILG